MAKVLDLNSESIATIFSSIDVVRDHPTKSLTSVDIENHVSQAVWKFFDKCRQEAAERFGLPEGDLIMTDVRIIGVRIDGHRVINPVGFTGRQLDIELMLSIARRDSIKESGLAVEGGCVRAHMLSGGESRGSFYIEIGTNRTSVFWADDNRVSYINGFDWGRENIENMIMEALDIEKDVAWRIYERAVEERLSDRLLSKVERAFYKHFISFVNGASMTINNSGALKEKGSPNIYIKADFSLPNSVYRKRFKFGSKEFKLLVPHKALSIEEFFDDNIHGVYEELNELARRRIKWLTTV